jgi:hypothetical protein
MKMEIIKFETYTSIFIVKDFKSKKTQKNSIYEMQF